MVENTLYLDVLSGKPVERPPVWLMRQAGRILPEYRALRASLSGFKELVETPALAAEVTVQPIDHLGVDAAIVFSDILTVPEAMGLPYEMIKGFGPKFPKTITSVAQLDQLVGPEAAADSLEYVYEAVKASKKLLANRVPLIGFAGAPWTIMCYMIEGQGSKTFSNARKWLRQEPAASQRLLEQIADTTALYLKKQILAGAQAVQLFDSWAGVLSPEMYQRFALPASQRVLRQLEQDNTPRILFAKGAFHTLKAVPEADAYGVDWTIPAKIARQSYGESAILQGNLYPTALYGDASSIAQEVNKMLGEMGGRHIANLGHGVYPDTPLEGVKAFIEAVKAYRYTSSPMTV